MCTLSKSNVISHDLHLVHLSTGSHLCPSSPTYLSDRGSERAGLVDVVGLGGVEYGCA